MTDRVIQLAKDMAGYAHHAGYPNYDGGHSEPEAECQHPDCVAVREAQAAADPQLLGNIIRRALPVAHLQLLPECITHVQLCAGKKLKGGVRITFISDTQNLTPGEVLDPETARNVGVVIWVPRAIYQGGN